MEGTTEFGKWYRLGTTINCSHSVRVISDINDFLNLKNVKTFQQEEFKKTKMK